MMKWQTLNHEQFLPIILVQVYLCLLNVVPEM